MTRLVDAPAEIASLVTATSEATGIPPAFVEKDIWVVEVLRSVAQPINGIAIFKGGTSLSKAYDLIERFSEDLDILIVPEAGCGRGCRDSLMKTMCARVAEDLPIERTDSFSDKGIHRRERFVYPVGFSATEVSDGVLLEMGVRGGPDPHERRSVMSYVAAHAVGSMGAKEDAFPEFAPVEIDVLRPERTLIEKLGILHHLAHASEETIESTEKGRHFYDVYQLLGDEDVVGALSHRDLVVEVAADAEAISAKYGWAYTPRPDDGFGGSPAFDRAHPSHKHLAAAYDRAEFLIYGTKPTFDDIIDRVGAHAELL